MRNESSLIWETLRDYDDVAGRRFDEALAVMPLSDLQRRELRFWQRQSMEALRQYAARAVPAALSAVQQAQQEADELVSRAASAWERAARVAAAVAAAAAESQPDAPAADPGEPVATAAGDAEPDALEVRRRALAARLATGS